MDEVFGWCPSAGSDEERDAFMIVCACDRAKLLLVRSSDADALGASLLDDGGEVALRTRVEQQFDGIVRSNDQDGVDRAEAINELGLTGSSVAGEARGQMV
jgi:hypothetical protein